MSNSKAATTNSKAAVASKYFTWHKPPSSSGREKPKVAVVVLGWMGATQNHLRRYAESYTKRGIQVITFVVPLDEALSWDLGKTVDDRIEILSKEVFSWLSDDGDRDRRLIFHTLSTTGWLVYGSILGHMQGQPDLIDKIKGCIFDSGGDPELNPKVWAAGFGAALLRKRNTRISPVAEAKAGNTTSSDTDDNISKLREEEEGPDHILEAGVLLALEMMFTIVFKIPEVNQKLSKITSRLTENQPQCPQLYLYSTADKVIRYRIVESFIRQQKMIGKYVKSFNFGSSPHVDHYRTFPVVYSSLVDNFIDKTLKSSWGNQDKQRSFS